MVAAFHFQGGEQKTEVAVQPWKWSLHHLFKRGWFGPELELLLIWTHWKGIVSRQVALRSCQAIPPGFHTPSPSKWDFFHMMKILIYRTLYFNWTILSLCAGGQVCVEIFCWGSSPISILLKTGKPVIWNLKKKHAATPNISDGRSKSLNLRGRGVWIGGVNSTQGLAYQTQGLQSHDGFVGLQGVLFHHTP